MVEAVAATTMHMLRAAERPAFYLFLWRFALSSCSKALAQAVEL
jgi:hypothetical protein